MRGRSSAGQSVSETHKPRSVTKRLGRPPDTAIPLCAHPDRHGVSYIAAEEWMLRGQGRGFSLRAACRRATIILGRNYDVADPRFPGFKGEANPAERRKPEVLRHKSASGTVKLTLRNPTGGRGKDWSADCENLRKAFLRARSPSDAEWLRHSMTAWILYLDPRGASGVFERELSTLRAQCERDTDAEQFWMRMWRIRHFLVGKGLVPPS